MSVAAAASIGRMLARDAIWHHGACTWIGRRPPSRTPGPDFIALGPDLFGGTAGIAWFLAELFAATGDAEFRRTALGAIRHAIGEAPRVARGRARSLFAGVPGIALAAALVGRRTRDAAALAGSRRLSESAMSDARALGHDLVMGAAGAIVAFDALAAVLRSPALLDRASVLGEGVVRSAERTEHGLSWPVSGARRFRNLAGMAHGASGVAVALLALFAATRDPQFREAAEAAFSWERSLFDPRRGNWPDLSEVRRGRTPRHPAFVSWWCHGAPGIALARIRAAELLGDAHWREEAVTALETTRASLASDLDRGTSGPALCHGLAGNAAVLHEGLRFLPARGRADARRLIAAAARASFRLVARSPLESPALFTGAAGVGWLHLRISDERLPSVLLVRREDFRPGPLPSESRSHREARIA